MRVLIALGLGLSTFLFCGLGYAAEEVTSVELDDYEAREYTDATGNKIQYRLFVPRGYDPEKKYPLVLFHHGAGGSGNDNRRNLEGACVWEWAGPERQAENPAFIVAPQIPRNRNRDRDRGDGPSRNELMRGHTRTIHEILDGLEKEFPIDTSRETN